MRRQQKEDRLKTKASAKGRRYPLAPVFERLEPRIMLSADLSYQTVLDPLPSAQDEQVLSVDLYPGSQGLSQEEGLAGQTEVVAQAEPAVLSVLTVNNTNDAGPGSLRQAILEANANLDPNPIRICFNIGDGGPQTIGLESALPQVQHLLIIDGTSQPGITLDATGVGTGAVLTIAKDGCIVQGLAISNAQGTAIQLLNANGCTLSDLDLSWTGEGRSGTGLYLWDSSDNTISHVRAWHRYHGLALAASHGNHIDHCDGSNAEVGLLLGLLPFGDAVCTSEGNTVEDSTFAGSSVGIDLVSGINSVFARNNCSGCGTGIIACEGAFYGRGARVSGTEVRNNDLRNSSAWGLTILGDSSFVLEGNQFQGSTNGLSVGLADGVRLQGSAAEPLGVGVGVLDLQGISGTALQLSRVTNSTVQNLDLSGPTAGRTGTGLYLWDSSDNTISNVRAWHRCYGLALAASQGNHIDHCDGSNAEVGLLLGLLPFGDSLWTSEGNTVEDSTFAGSGVGIDLVSGINSVFARNNCSGCGTGIIACEGAFYGRGARVSGTEVRNNDLRNSSAWGLTILGDSSFVLEGNQFQGSTNGLSVGLADGVRLQGSAAEPLGVGVGVLDLQGISGTALQLSGVTNSTVENLDLSGPTAGRTGTGLYLWDSSDNTISNVRAWHRCYGLALAASQGNHIDHCDGSNAEVGLLLGLRPFGDAVCTSEGNTVEDSTFAGSGVGIDLVSGINSVFARNNCSGCGTGIIVCGGEPWYSRGARVNGTEVRNNDLRNSSAWGLTIYGDSSFVLEGNQFQGSTNGLSVWLADGVRLQGSAAEPLGVGVGVLDLQGIAGTALQLIGVTNSTVEDLDLSGPTAGRTGMGLYVRHSSGNTIEDVVAANRAYGFELSWADNNTIRRCAGTNTGTGVQIGYDYFFDVFAPGDGNTVEGSRFVGSTGGILLYLATNTVIQDNDVSGCMMGVLVGCLGIAADTKIQGNSIHSNTGSGLVVYHGTGNQIQGNSIYSNGGLGIDLGGNGVTPNDEGDVDMGSNNFQNFPVLATVLGGYTTRIQGSLNSSPDKAFTLDFYANTVADPSGYGEGQRYLGSATVTTDAFGNVSFNVELTARTRSGEFITATATDPDGNTSEFSLAIIVPNMPPSLDEATFEIEENSPNGTVVGTVVGSDPDGDTLRYGIVGGSGSTAFAIDEATGQITVADATQLDYETNPSFKLEIEVRDEHDATAQATMTIHLLNQASVTGVVFLDVNRNGVYEANEPGIDGVTVQLQDGHGVPVRDANGNAIMAKTSDGGFYLFEDLRPGVYRLHEVQPTGVDDGAEILGSLGGTVPANDTMQLVLGHTDAGDYAFAELGQAVTRGDTATIGFWQNKNGQELIRRGGTALADWLTDNFGNVFGDTFVGGDGDDVALFFKDQLFLQKAGKSAGPAKVDAQFMAVALATYFTSSNLAGNVASAYGFHVTDTGIGTKVVNVGNRGAAFGVANGTSLTIMQLLLATNSLTDLQNHLRGFAHIYDRNGDGVIDTVEAQLRGLANELFTLINESGGQ